MSHAAASFDYVVVGGGSAGSAVARRLVEDTGATVLVLEGGGPVVPAPSLHDPARWVENIGSAFDYGYRYEPHPATHDRPHLLSRGKVLGGSGAVNALLWTRGHRADYDAWAGAGHTGWDFESVLPLFRRSEDWEDGESRLRGAGGPVRVERAKDLHPVASALIEAGMSLGMPYLDDVSPEEPEGVGPTTMNVRDGRRVNPWDAYMGPVLHEERLTVLTGATARELVLTGGRCLGVRYALGGKPAEARADSAVILSAGAIDTPGLLLRSGIGPAADLARAGVGVHTDLPGVGENLQEHPLLAGLCLEPAMELPAPNNNLEGSVAFWRSDPGVDRPDLMFVAMQVPYVSAEIAARCAVPPDGFCIVPGLSRPRSRGRLWLDCDGEVRVQPNMLEVEADATALLRGVDIGLDLASRPGFRRIAGRQVVPEPGATRSEKVAFLRDAAMPYLHPVGTCAMGPVVDAQLRVHGVEGLRIADASVMPEIVSTYPHATTVMIGEFAGALLAAG
ncbi:GMC family oxidoreductase [Streptomyces sp. NPDC088732]|uniref:GMC family oxidoreductase n=1 Tax=Streptomyces sp. NPDC088732 TaxID=3365879 RepID=UPI003825ABC7